MKDNIRQGRRKALLMAMAVILVAVVSVSMTLTYLTAMTNEKVNSFTASTTGLTGEVLEPGYNTTNSSKVNPGDTYYKDPLIVNTTQDESMWVGAKMSFKLNGKNVSYDTFKHYVSLYTDTPPASYDNSTGYGELFNTGTNLWEKVGTSDTSGPHSAYRPEFLSDGELLRFLPI